MIKFGSKPEVFQLNYYQICSKYIGIWQNLGLKIAYRVNHVSVTTLALNFSFLPEKESLLKIQLA